MAVQYPNWYRRFTIKKKYYFNTRHTYPEVAHECAKRPFSKNQVEQGHGHDEQGHAQVGDGQRHEQIVTRAPKLADQAHGDADEHVADDRHHDDQEQHGADGERFQRRVR